MELAENLKTIGGELALSSTLSVLPQNLINTFFKKCPVQKMPCNKHSSKFSIAFVKRKLLESSNDKSLTSMLHTFLNSRTSKDKLFFETKIRYNQPNCIHDILYLLLLLKIASRCKIPNFDTKLIHGN